MNRQRKLWDVCGGFDTLLEVGCTVPLTFLPLGIRFLFLSLSLSLSLSFFLTRMIRLQ